MHLTLYYKLEKGRDSLSFWGLEVSNIKITTQLSSFVCCSLHVSMSNTEESKLNEQYVSIYFPVISYSFPTVIIKIYPKLFNTQKKHNEKLPDITFGINCLAMISKAQAMKEKS